MQKDSLIYVAGHTGLIGSAVVKQLKSAGFNNLLLARHNELELTDAVATADFFEKNRPEYVVLSAGKVGGIIENKTYPADFINANLAIQLNVMKAAHNAGVKKLIFFASSCMYPRECPQPMKEEALFSGYPEPTSMAYAVSKMAGLQMCLAYNQQYGEKRFIPVIPNSAFGANDNFDPQGGHVLSALIRRFDDAKKANAKEVVLWGSGTPRREFIYSEDIADACIALLGGDTSNLDFPLNLGSGDDFSIRELAEKIANVVGFTGEIGCDTSKPDGAPRKLLDSSRIHNFGWKPKVDFDTGLKSTYEWYLQNIANSEKK